ncbi:paxillin-like isoform X1 [Saccostrea echinata]|uniref:paxillin-like isoform X1 n=1 Tax=Saccostrea echinata TaxID=191078 RepID=UPI002A83A30C|nr:paxillin-like isoform X1 [Saccostrea echinata]
MQHYSQRVMEDLDALLADLQNTTTQVRQYQHADGSNRAGDVGQPREPVQNHAQYRSTNNDYDERYTRRSSGSETPPPLPPPPPQELLESIPPPKQFDQPMYYETGVTQVNADQPRTSQLSNNLSELDQLLKDLNSAQFMAEVDKRNSGNQPITNGGGKQPPPVAPKPSREDRTSVGGLLDMLEGSVPDTPNNNYRSPPTNDNYEYTSDVPPAQPQQTTIQIQPKPQATSTATRELDELMATLSGFKVSGGSSHERTQRSVSPSSEPPYAKPQKRNPSQSSAPSTPVAPQREELDSMLGNLHEDMKSQGVTTKTKGVCGACNQPVIGQVITALGKVWHIEHFTCANCNLPLGTKNFYERDGAAYCEEDYHKIFAPKCAYCNGSIVDKCVTALDMTWHPEHFFCAQCGNPFGDDGFHEKNGKAYCRQDFLEMFAPRCGGCGHPILDNYISALSRHWHPECFVCRDCHQPFGGRSFFDHEGLPYCETHYHAKRGSLCATCQKPITGRCITAMSKKFHPEHFTCAFCLKQLNKGTFKEQNDKPYCHPCFVKLFG